MPSPLSKIIDLTDRQHRLMKSGDITGAKRVGAQIEGLQRSCNHRRTFTKVAAQESPNGRVKKGDLVTWCKECQLLLSPKKETT